MNLGLKPCARTAWPFRIIKRSESDAKTVLRDVKPFKDIPGPKSLPIVGTLIQYFPFIGKYNFEKLHVNGALKMKEYGPLVREEMVPGVNVLWIFRPEDIAEIFRIENRDRGLHPKRRSHLALEKYRTDRKNVYNTGGLLPTNGTDWWRIRREFQKGLSRPQSVRIYLEETDNVVREFIKLIVEADHEDFLPVLSRLYLELTCLVAFDVRLHSASAKELREDSRSSKLIEAANSTNSTILKLDNGPRLWRFFNTPMYRRLCRAQSFMENVAVDMVSKKIELMKTRTNTDERSLLEMYLANPNLDKKDVIGMACDMLLAGMDTTTNSTSFALYHLARNPRVQDKLYKEALALLPSKDDAINDAALSRATYTKAVIKETFRMNPISVGIGRVLQTDAVLSGYHVPKGTVIVTQNQVICRDEEHFDEPNEFKPERWIRESDAAPAQPYNPFLVLPFGHGARSCIARRLAEQNMQIALLRICRDFEFSWGGKEELDCLSLLINVPNAPERNRLSVMVKENQEIGINQGGDKPDQLVEVESIGRKTYEKRNFEITTKFRNRMEYLAILFILQSGNNNFLLTATKCGRFKGISFLILYYGIHHIFIAPLQCQNLFLGYYSKYGYMKIWNIFPIGYGIGASMMAVSLYTCINLSALTGQLVLQFALTPFTPDNYWTECSYESENLPPCYELNSEPKENVDCNLTYYPAIAQYYRVSELWRPDEKLNGIGPANTKWIAASALVWIIVCILTIRDFDSFKGIFVKLIYFVTTLSLLMTALQWRTQRRSDKGTLLMLDFTGLYDYKIWVKALVHAILMSHICEGTLIQLGSYATENIMPDTDALLVGFVTSILQYIGIYYLYSSYGSMAETYTIDVNCFVWSYEPIFMALVPTQLSLLPMAKLWIITGFLILLVKGIMEMTIVFTSTINSFSEAFPSVRAYRSYLVSVTALCCFLISIIFTTKAGAIFAHQSLKLVGTVVTPLILAVMSSLILFSYSVTRLCDDIQFIHKFEPTVLMKAVFYLTPLIATYYTVLHLLELLALPTRLNELYNGLWAVQPFLVLCYISLIAPMLIVGLVMYGIHVRTHTVGLLFHPTKYWGYPDEEVNVARSRFNPKRELRYMVKKPCAHVCLLNDERMQMEIKKREDLRNTLK